MQVMDVRRRSSADRTPPRLAAYWLTAAVFGVTLITSLAAFADPDLMRLMTRNLPQLRSGEWWRVFTPLLVQSDGWGQLAFNVLGIAVVGAAVQRRLGRLAWTGIYLVAGVGSGVVVLAWHPNLTGAGSSDAVAGLIGAFAVLLALETPSRPHQGDWAAQLYALFFAVYLSALDLGGLWWSIVVGNLAIIALVVSRRALAPRRLNRACALLIGVAGLVMSYQQDGHGTGIIAGATVCILALSWRRAHAAR